MADGHATSVSAYVASAMKQRAEADELQDYLDQVFKETGGPMTGRVWGGVEASRILSEGGVDLILTGHVHSPFAHPLPFGDHRTYAVGASTLSLRERGVPAGFNVIEVEEGCIRVTALGWIRTHFEPQRTWGFDRRGGTGCAPKSSVA